MRFQKYHADYDIGEGCQNDQWRCHVAIDGPVGVVRGVVKGLVRGVIRGWLGVFGCLFRSG